MTLLDQIQQRLSQLPPDKQKEVLDFVTFLQRSTSSKAKAHKTRSLRQHAAFGSWKERNINALGYEQSLRAEWDSPH
ncbi:MAG: DUF2281 domain-containing protein [Anaerolineae bacterium]|nr:DUF2281 domain-containing protein [Anaerolineae bacterium]